MRIDRHFVKQEIEDGGINLTYIPINSQEADILTKAMTRQGFELIISKLRMRHLFTCLKESVEGR